MIERNTYADKRQTGPSHTCMHVLPGVGKANGFGPTLARRAARLIPGQFIDLKSPIFPANLTHLLS